MALVQEELVRVFLFGALKLTDSDPTLSPIDSLRLYKGNYAELAHAEIDRGTVQEGKMIYKVIPLKAGVKG